MRRLFLMLLFLATAEASLGAAVTTETFQVGANGWVGGVSIAGAWSFTGSVARVSFFDTGVPIPDEANLTNQPFATSGSFTGNFVSAGIELIGVRFQARNFLPSDIQLSFRGATSIYHRSFSIAQTGVWYTLAASLNDAQRGGWTNVAGGLDDFQHALTEVKSVGVRIVRSGQSAQDYLIGEIFLDHLPASAGLAVADGEYAATWQRLRPTVSYVVEGSTNLLASPWVPLAQFAATNESQSLALPATNNPQFLRLGIR